VRDPTAGDLASRIYTLRISQWHWPSSITVAANDTDWARLKEAALRPTLFAAGETAYGSMPGGGPGTSWSPRNGQI
jgi:hypothetical protein